MDGRERLGLGQAFCGWAKEMSFYSRCIVILICAPLIGLGLWKLWDMTDGWPLWHRALLLVSALCIAPGPAELLFRVVQGWRR
jgi:hypothetical protein